MTQVSQRDSADRPNQTLFASQGKPKKSTSAPLNHARLLQSSCTLEREVFTTFIYAPMIQTPLLPPVYSNILSGAHIETGGMVVTPPFTLSCIRMFFQSFNHEELVCCLTSYHVLPLLFIIQMSKQLAALLPSACLNMQTLKDVQLVSKY